MLVFTPDDRLVAILTRLTEQHGSLAGLWFLEAGFGPVDGLDHPTFAALDAGLNWIAERLHSRMASTLL